jgi:broad specificity phosphatase PhoE
VRARNFGAVESFVQAEAETYTIIEVEDARTCVTCSYMNGREFTVTGAVRLRDAFARLKRVCRDGRVLRCSHGVAVSAGARGVNSRAIYRATRPSGPG